MGSSDALSLISDFLYLQTQLKKGQYRATPDRKRFSA